MNDRFDNLLNRLVLGMKLAQAMVGFAGTRRVRTVRPVDCEGMCRDC
jgi:hypothetical protein